MKDSKKFLKSIGIRNYKAWPPFWNGLKKRYGEPAKKLLAAIGDRADGDAGNAGTIFYKLKNSSLDLSLEISSQYYFEIYKNYINWFTNLDLKAPERLIDLACDNGVLGCFYATHFPDSEIIGIDSCPEAIVCANQLARKLGLKNVKFEEKKLEDSVYLNSLGEFDIVTATTSFYDFLGVLRFGANEGSTNDRYFSTLEIDLERDSSEIHALMLPITNLVKPETGFFITLDRWTDAGGLWWWANTLNKSGVSIDFIKSDQIKFKNADGNEEKLPLLVGRRLKETLMAKNTDILSLYSYFAITAAPDKYKYEDEIAEALISSINSKELLGSYKLEYLDGSGVHKCELWATDSLLLVYNYTNIGFRELTIQSLLSLGSIIDALNDKFEKMKGSTKFTEYENIESIRRIIDRISAKGIMVSPSD
jgi:hypothetical protein